MTPPAATLKDRPRGAATAVRHPTAARLRSLYVDDELSIQAVAQRLGFTAHLVRTWLLEDGTPIRPAGGRAGMAHPGRPLKPAPAVAELRRLRAERLGRREIAAQYGVHPQTVSKGLAEAGLPARLPPAGPMVTDTEIAGMYRESTDSAARIARRLGVRDGQVVAALCREGVALDPDRRIAAVRAAGARRRGTVPSLPAELGEQAAVLYREQGWSYQRVAEQLGVTVGKVRAELRRRGIPAHTHTPTRPASRSARTKPRSTRCARCRSPLSSALRTSPPSWTPPRRSCCAPDTPTACRSVGAVVVTPPWPPLWRSLTPCTAMSRSVRSWTGTLCRGARRRGHRRALPGLGPAD